MSSFKYHKGTGLVKQDLFFNGRKYEAGFNKMQNSHIFKIWHNSTGGPISPRVLSQKISAIKENK